MSCFAGLLHNDDRPVERHDMERLARALPEFDGARASIWTAQSVGLVHRLYIVTPEDRFERQPRAAGAKFRYGLPRAVHLGNFICWFEGSNR